MKSFANMMIAICAMFAEPPRVCAFSKQKAKSSLSRTWSRTTRLASEVNGHLPTSPKVRGNTHFAEVLRRPLIPAASKRRLPGFTQ